MAEANDANIASGAGLGPAAFQGMHGVEPAPPTVRPAPTTGESPNAKRPPKREVAPVQPAPARDMSPQEMTSALQQIMAQQAIDGRMIELIKDMVEDHATRIDTEEASRAPERQARQHCG